MLNTLNILYTQIERMAIRMDWIMAVTKAAIRTGIQERWMIETSLHL